MNRKQNTLIYYHVPEDHDHPDQPNVFLVPLPKNKLQLQHIYQHFPLKGTYAFRFKIAFNELIVWLDLNDPQSVLPAFKEQIHIKASRLSWQEFKNPQTNISYNCNFGRNHHSKESIDILEHHPPPPSQKKEGSFIHVADVSLLDSNSPGSSPLLHPAVSEPAFKIDFFREQQKPKIQEFHAQMPKDLSHGDLI